MDLQHSLAGSAAADAVVTERVIFSALSLAAPTAARESESSSSSSSSLAHALPPVRRSVASPNEERAASGTPRPRGPQRMSCTPFALLNARPVAADDCAAVWRFLSHWTQAQLAMEAPAAIPRFGIVSLKTHALSIRIPHFGTGEERLLLLVVYDAMSSY